MGARLVQVVGDLKTAVVLLDDGTSRLCIVTAPLTTESVEMRREIEQAVTGVTGMKASEVVTFGSHNHCAAKLVENATMGWSRPPGAPAAGELTAIGWEFIAGLRRTAAELQSRLVPVTVEWGVAREDRFVYNRRGRRPDGRTYFIREEDRVLLGDGYIGQVDPDATLVVLRGRDGRPVAGLAHYTGHPATSYNPERPIAFGEWPQVACEAVSEKIGAPVAFFQGCAGDINSKFLLTGTVAQSREFGGHLAQSLLKAYGSLTPSARSYLRFRRVTAELPFADLPAEESGRRDLAEIDEFIRRGQAGDPEALYCVGMNFPRALTPPYRARLVEMIRPWFVWAIETYQNGRLGGVPKSLPVEVFTARIGDIGLVGLPFEPFVRIGLRIKREAGLPCVLPCGYCGGANGYVPDASACDDREYMSGFFRYTRYRPPYRPPGGEAAAIVAAQALRDL